MKNINIKALFLGPKAENQSLYETLIGEIVKDSCFLRKNFHPSDEPIVTEKVKLSGDYNETVALLKQELQNILADLKKGVPLYHPRYIGHMHGDILLPAIAAYFGSMLYNPNNVVGESSPATTKMEIEYIDALCRMVGYKPCKNVTGDYSWGHLSAGGTTANIEALWVARNLKYYPLSVKLSYLLETDIKYKFIGDVFLDSLSKDVKKATFTELFNLPVGEILNLKDKIYDMCNDNEIGSEYIKAIIEKYSVTNMGIYGIHHCIEEVEGKNNKNHIELPKVYIASTYHYSWEKAMDVVGIGRDQMVKIDIDDGYRMDIECLKDKINKTKSPTLMVVGILGTSKQGSIDPIDDIVEFRSECEQKSGGHSFVIHIDGAYGGYLTSMFNKEEDSEKFASNRDIIKYLSRENDLFRLNGQTTVNEKWCNKIKAVKQSDSITIDPHKMGYIPYPAGSILFADTRMKDFISYQPTYLNKPSDENDLYTAFLGQWTLEGSRPGAAASACFLSNKVLPFTQEGHGLLIRNSMHTADIFWNSIETFNGNREINKGFKVVPLYTPETNIISYVVSCPEAIKKSIYLNQFTEELYDHFSVKGDTIIPEKNFIVAKDSFQYHDIPNGSFFRDCGIDDVLKENQLEMTYLSSVFMNPLSVYLEKDFYMNFWKEVVNVGQNIKADILCDILSKEHDGERISVLWIEDQDVFNVEIRKKLLLDPAIGKCLNISFVNNLDDAKKEQSNDNKDFYIIDLNLVAKHDLDSKSFTQYDRSNIQRAIDFIKDLPSEKKDKIIIYSSYLHNEKIKETEILPLLEPILGTKSIKNRLIAKTHDYLFDKQQIVNAIFILSQA